MPTQIAADQALYCPRCGAYEYWEIMGLDRKETDKDGEVLVYRTVCTQCGRPEEFRTRDVQSIPERVKIREELFQQEGKFDPKKRMDSDMAGFSADKVKPRLQTEKGV
jgi:C4-type Zn-finger protein